MIQQQNIFSQSVKHKPDFYGVSLHSQSDANRTDPVNRTWGGHVETSVDGAAAVTGRTRGSSCSHVNFLCLSLSQWS